MSEAGLLTVTEIVEKYGVSRKTIQRWVNSDPPKVLPALTLPGKTGAHLFAPEEAERAFGAHKEAKETKATEKAPEPVEEPVVKPKAPRKPRAKKVVADEPEQLLLPVEEDTAEVAADPTVDLPEDDDFEPPAVKK